MSLNPIRYQNLLFHHNNLFFGFLSHLINNLDCLLHYRLKSSSLNGYSIHNLYFFNFFNPLFSSFMVFYLFILQLLVFYPQFFNLLILKNLFSFLFILLTSFKRHFIFKVLLNLLLSQGSYPSFML